MQCMAHPTRAASNVCDRCGHWLCEECTSNLGGRLLCKSCVAAQGLVESVPEFPRRNSNILLLLVFSFLFPPGANYMYLGLVKRGLAVMCAFFLLIYMIVALPWPILMLAVFSIPILWFASFFGGFNTRSRIAAGEFVADDISDITAVLRRNRVLTFVVLGIVGISVAGSLFGFAVEIMRRAMPVLLILLVIYVIFRKKD